MSFASSGPRSLAALLLAIGLGSSPSAQAQQANATLPLVPGMRVRVTARSLVVPLVANYLQTRGDTAVFIEDAAGRGLWSIPIAEITRLERAAGDRTTNRPYMIRGAWIGGAAGAVTMLVFASTASPSDSGRRYGRMTNSLLGAGAGGVIGALIGSRFAVERWTPVPLRQVSIVPSRRGVGIAIGF